VSRAVAEGIVKPILIGDKKRIKELLKEVGSGISEGHIVDEPDHEAAAALAVKQVRDGKADILMKGKLHTAQFLKPVLNKDTGIGKGGVLSVVAIAELKKYHKLLVITDPGMVISPTLEQKKEILNNAVRLLHKMGYENPKVAVMTALEEINSKMPETEDAAALAEMNKKGQITGCLVEGPVSMDIALSAERAAIKGYKGRIPGNTDIMLLPSVVSGNLLTKALEELADSQFIALVAGASVPLVLTSRSSSEETKYMTICAAVASA
jgi:phosphate butyryltransferase